MDMNAVPPGTYDVLVSGVASADFLFPGLSRIPGLGEETASEDFLIKPGGAANVATALQRLGLRTALVAPFGEDVAGRMVLAQLAGLGLDLSPMLVSADVRTPVTAVLSCGSERGFATYFGSWDDAAVIARIRSLLPACRYVYGSIRDCRTYGLHALAREAGRPCAVDMAWEEGISLPDVEAVLDTCSVFFANEVEARLLTGCDEPEEALALLLRRTPLAVVKLGPNGSLVGRGEEVLHVPAVDVPKVVDTTGAGDCYCAGFLFGLMQGWPLADCASFASASGSLAVTFAGGVDASYTREAVDALRKRGETKA
jgi:sugar/nucleoside kinase (ribokinase family)